jgi:hypothetical protein
LKIVTTFWSDAIHEFNKLLYINGRTEEVLFEANLNDVFETFLFFRNLSKFVKSREVLNSYYKEDWFQFAVVVGGTITHIKWFDIVLDDDTTLSHDIAFETTLVRKNGFLINFGGFPYHLPPTKRRKLPKYREYNIKSRAYKYVSNRIKMSWNSPNSR